MSTFTGTPTSGIALSGAPQNPATVTAADDVTNYATPHSAHVINGNTASGWNFTTFDAVEKPGVVSGGVNPKAGATATNAAAGWLSGEVNGVAVFGGADGVSNSATARQAEPNGTDLYRPSGGALMASAPAAAPTAAVQFNGTYYYGIVLSNPATQNPSTLSAGGYVTNIYGGDAVYGTPAAAWNFVNLGRIEANFAYTAGVDLRAGGTVTNATAASIFGAAEGVKILGAAGSISNSGAISATSLGIYLGSGGMVVNGATNATSAQIAGGLAGVSLYGSTTSTINNFGSIKGTGAGSAGVALRARGVITNAAGAKISGIKHGIYLNNSGDTVSNSGTISGTGIGTDGHGIYMIGGGSVSNASSGMILGGNAGVVMLGTAANTVNNLGTIASIGSAGLYGVYMRGPGTVINGATNATSAAIYGAVDGVNMHLASGVGTVSNFGRLQGTGAASNGIYLISSGIVTNAQGALIAGAINGIFISGGTSTVSNSGTIKGTGTLSDGVHLAVGGIVANALGGAILGLTNGAQIDSSAGTITNLGTVAGTGTGGGGVYLRAGGNVVNNSGGLITGVNVGIEIAGTVGAVSNSGRITGTGTASDGVHLAGGGNVTNASGGVILGLINGAQIDSSAGTVTNLGTLAGTGTAGSGVYLRAGGSVINNASGLITGIRNGGAIGNNGGSVTNFGTIRGTGTGGGGVFLIAGGNVVNNSSGLITGVNVGIEIAGTVGAVSNSGMITGTGTASDGVHLAGGGNVTNASGGVILGLINGAQIDSSAGTVTNLGTLAGTGTAGSGAYLRAGGSVVNSASGLITGINVGIAIAGTSGYVTNSSSGVITGLVDGVRIASTSGIASGTVVNSGTISGTSTTYAIGVGDAIFINTGSGLVTNSVSGRLVGVNNGVEITASAGTVGNSGSITGNGSLGVGVFLRATGGFVTNVSGGVITGVFDGVRIGSTATAASGTVINSGTISGTGTGAAGIAIYSGGVVQNNAGGRIVAAFNGVYVNSTSGNVSNFGAVSATGTNSDGVHLAALGGLVTNNVGGSISGVLNGVEIDSIFGAVDNFGTISGTGTHGAGIYILAGGGGYVVNQAGGMLAGPRFGVDINSYAGLVKNAGTVLGTGTTGIGVIIGSGTVVNNAGAVINGPLAGIAVYAGNVSNSGTVITGTSGFGIYVHSGNVTNSSSGTILASGSLATAVLVRYGTFFNSGVLQGRVFGVELSSSSGTAGRTVTLTGTVAGATGIGVAPGSTASQTLTVSGTVSGTSGTAVSLTKAGSDRLILAPGALFQGMVDGGGGKSVVEVAASGPGVAGAGAGAGDGTAAITGTISLGGVTNFSALQVDFSAAVDASGNLIFDTLVNQGQINLAAGDSLVVGTVANSANGGTIDLRSGGSVHFTGAVAAGQTVLFRPPGGTVSIDHPEQFAAAMTQFDMTDTIDLPLGQATFQQYAGGVLSLSYGGGTVALQLTTISATPQFIFTGDGHGGTDITVNDTTCFCRGTHILTDRGEVAVEDLAVGDRVRTLSGAVKPIVWIGIGRGLVTRKNRLARPIIVRRSALADNVPHRDLYLTHGHALYFASEEVLIPVEHLVNHRSILWDEADRVVEYYHIELEDHDVLLAEGAPAESYYDADNRALFHHTRPGSQPGAATTTFAPVQNGGELVETVWARLYARAGGEPGGKPEREVTADPDLHLVVDRERIDPEALGCGVYRFAVARPPVDRMLLRSRCGVPSLLGLGRSDHRRLGVAIQKIVWHHAGIASCFDYDQPQLREGGCYQPENGFCWTDGELQLPGRFFSLLNGAFTLVVHTQPHPEMRYPVAAPLTDETRQAA